MKDIKNYNLAANEAAIWFLGQAGYLIKSNDIVVAIDPYLTDSAANLSPELSRIIAAPFEPSELDVDVYIVTHDHIDHLDPQTIEAYPYKTRTTFVAPRLAARKLIICGIPEENIVRIDTGETKMVKGITITGIFTIPNEPAVSDTCGYRLEFKNGRSVYHSSDTAYSELLLNSVPEAEVALLCINGKWGNMGPAQAAKIAQKIHPEFAVPNHYDLMVVNSENPEKFRIFVEQLNKNIEVIILDLMKPFVWK